MMANQSGLPRPGSFGPGAPPSGPGDRALRKLRWAAAGRGKRNGYRVIYFVRRPKGVIWMLTIHPKNVSDTIPARALKQIREEIDDD